MPRSPRPTAVALIRHLKGREKALEPFGLTGRRAEWVALASLHGGVFTRSQLRTGSASTASRRFGSCSY
ncbi:MAG: hypothetical protein OXH66_13020 [Gemmatimonadetes bacterium]|nr:hypothetical protein [Gemmatimonadota bacterium]